MKTNADENLKPILEKINMQTRKSKKMVASTPTAATTETEAREVTYQDQEETSQKPTLWDIDRRLEQLKEMREHLANAAAETTPASEEIERPPVNGETAKMKSDRCQHSAAASWTGQF